MKINVKCSMCGESYFEPLRAVIYAFIFNLLPTQKRKRLGKLSALCPSCWSVLFRSFSEVWNE